MSEWISIKERNPDISGYYLVSGNGEIWICEFIVLGNIVGGWSNDALNPCVEAWIELPKVGQLYPKPYKRDDN